MWCSSRDLIQHDQESDYEHDPSERWHPSVAFKVAILILIDAANSLDIATADDLLNCHVECLHPDTDRAVHLELRVGE